jgi:hypothetical protein
MLYIFVVLIRSCFRLTLFRTQWLYTPRRRRSSKLMHLAIRRQVAAHWPRRFTVKLLIKKRRLYSLSVRRLRLLNLKKAIRPLGQLLQPLQVLAQSLLRASVFFSQYPYFSNFLQYFGGMPFWHFLMQLISVRTLWRTQPQAFTR